MSQMSDYLEGQLVAHIFRTAAWAKPTGLTVRLYTAMPGEAGGGTEVTGTGYAGVAVGPSDATWAAPVTGDGHTENVGVIQFGSPTAAWGTIVGFGITDQVPNLLIYGSLTASKTVNSGDAAPSFAAGALDVTFA